MKAFLFKEKHNVLIQTYYESLYKQFMKTKNAQKYLKNLTKNKFIQI